MSTKVITGKVRASFVHVFEPAAINGGEPKYSCSLIIPKSDTVTIGKIREAIELAKQEGVPTWGGKIPPNLKLPLRDGDVDRPDDPAYENSYFINATSQEQPGIVDRKRVKITDPLAIYSGCYIRASINIYPFFIKVFPNFLQGIYYDCHTINKEIFCILLCLCNLFREKL